MRGESGPAERADLTPGRRRPGLELFLVSLLILFLELACIRWFPAHVLFLTFFTNTVLLACFLGMSVGCMAARRAHNFLCWTPLLLAVALVAAHGVEKFRTAMLLDVGHQSSPQMVFFGTEYRTTKNVDSFPIPIEAVGGFFFLIIALAMVGPGQELGRAFNRVPNRVRGYTWNILGSIVGIVLFAASSWLQLPPLWWFLPIALGIAYFLIAGNLVQRRLEAWLQLTALVAVILLGAVTSGIYPLSAAAETFAKRMGMHPAKEQPAEGVTYWSPYYRIDYDFPPKRVISVNLIGHQQMLSRDWGHPEYAFPHLLNRDSGGAPFNEVLVIGAGSGNDVSRALQWGAKHVDAVEIDPRIMRLGQEDHPDRPYDDPRVTRHLGDGRNFLRSTDKQYDLIVYALVDSLVLHSSYSNIRLESYLFTQQAFNDVRRHLKPGGRFVMYNWFRQGWIVARLEKGLEDVFGTKPLVMTLPYHKTIEPEAEFRGFTIFTAGDEAALKPLQEAFRKHPHYWLRDDVAAGPTSPNGFSIPDKSRDGPSWYKYGLASVVRPADLQTATDDWPFLYLRDRMIPSRPSLSGMAVMAGISLVLILAFMPKGGGEGKRGFLDGRMFFLGAGFMLIETKAVVHMALLFGGTWIVNSVVFFAVLVMILAANLFVLAVRPSRLWPYYAGLVAALALNAVIPLDYFLGLERTLQVAGSCLLVFAPILFAAVIFAVSFGRSKEPDRDFGANIAGAILGGLAEYTSMLLGFQYLMLVAVAFYLLSAVLGRRRQPAARVPEPVPVAVGAEA